MSEPDRIKVLMFLPSLGSGGAEMHAIRVANHLDRTRFQPLIATARGGGGYEKFVRKDVPVATLTRLTHSSTMSRFFSAAPLRRMIDETKPDVLVSFVTNFHVPAYAAAHRAVHRPRLVLTVQNNLSAKPLRSFGRRRVGIGLPLTEALKGADCLVAISSGVREDLRQQFGLQRQIDVIYNAGLDDAVLQAATMPCPERKPAGPVVMACGRLTEQKDYPTLLRAWALVGHQSGARLWILGTGPDRGRLEKLAKQLNISDRVSFLGFQSNPFCFMAAADLFVLSSRWEGFGNVIVEAMACGTAVIATDCPYGPAEILDNGRCGELVPVGDPVRLAAAIDGLLHDIARRQALAAAAKQRAQVFAAERIAAEYGELFSAVAAQPVPA